MEIDLGRGKVALIDDDDWTSVRCNYRKDGTVDRVSPCQLSWYYHERSGAVQSCYRRNGERNGYSLKLHRLISECPAEMFVNHANGNMLDNRKSNLRACEPRNCLCRRKAVRGKSSPYKGVLRDRGRNRYEAKIAMNKSQHTLGYFDTALEAAFAYDDAARTEYGEFARVNFPERKHGQEVRLYDGIRNGSNSITRKRKVVPNFDGKGHTKIEIGNDAFTIIDDADWFAVHRHFWRDGSFIEISISDAVWIVGANGYAKSSVRYGHKTALSMHRLITSCPPGLVVDHIDGNPLNNCRDNLRVCTHKQNIRNTRKRKPGVSGKFKGVHIVGSAKRAKRRFHAIICAENRIYRSSKYPTALEAALAYDDLAIKLHGEFACLNFPERHRAKAIA